LNIANMSVFRTTALRGLQNTLRSSRARVAPRLSAPSRSQLIAKRFASSGGHGDHPPPGSDIPWLIGAIVVTIPSAYYLWPEPKSAGHHGHDEHAESHEEHEEHEEKESKNEEALAEDQEEKSDGSEQAEEAKPEAKNDDKPSEESESKDDAPNEESKEDSKKESKEESKVESKEESKDDTKKEDQDDRPDYKDPNDEIVKDTKVVSKGVAGYKPRSEDAPQSKREAGIASKKHD